MLLSTLLALTTKPLPAVALGVLNYLVDLNVPADTAARLVVRLVAQGVADTHLMQFRRDVERDILIGSIPSQAASTRATSTELTASPLQDGNRGPRKNSPPPRALFRPAGAWSSSYPSPTVETVGYCRPSLAGLCSDR